MIVRSGWLVGSLVAFFAVTPSCTTESGDSADAGTFAPGRAYELAGDELRDPVALISTYLPYLTPPEDKPKYWPERRPDIQEAARRAADEIRHAANYTRQRAIRSGSEAATGLGEPLLAVAVACAEPADDGAVVKCRDRIRGLEQALEQAATKSKAAGVAQPFPRIGPDAITPKSKEAVAPFSRALGPGEAEKTYWKKMSASDATAEDVILACQAASAEVQDVMRGFDGKSETLHKLAAVHQQFIESQCNRLVLADAAAKGIDGCSKTAKKRPHDEKRAECKLNCAKAQRIVGEGIPAAVFLGLDETRLAECKDLED